MRIRLLAFPVAAVCLLLGVSACGGDESDSSDASAAVVEQIDAICDDWRETLDAREEFPVADFDTENPAAEDLPKVGDYCLGQSAAEDALESIRISRLLPMSKRRSMPWSRRSSGSSRA